jgi:hypothetical protein
MQRQPPSTVLRQPWKLMWSAVIAAGAGEKKLSREMHRRGRWRCISFYLWGDFMSCQFFGSGVLKGN